MFFLLIYKLSKILNKNINLFFTLLLKNVNLLAILILVSNMRKGMVMNINGWPVIEKLLLRRRKNQSDLARLLGVSPAAITQIKQGDFQLGVFALDKIMHYLGATPEEQDDIYTRVIQNRYFDKLDSGIIFRIIIIRRDER